MTITKNIIPIGVGIRTGKKLKQCLGLVVHWIGVCQPKAEKVRDSFTGTNLGTQYIIDWNDGHIIQCAPKDERCNHVGSANGYTEKVRKLIGRGNPNDYFVGIECCIGDKTIPANWYERGKHMELGRPSEAQYEALVEFAADFLTRHGLGTENLYRHYDITGKLCHVWFVKDEKRWEQFKADVAAKMKEDEDMTKEEVQKMIDDAKPKVYTSVEECPKWAQPLVQRAKDEGIIKGGSGGKLHLTDDNLVNLQMMYNMADKAGK